MAYKTFAAIDVGSFEVSMKIFEMSPRNGIRQLEYLSRGIDMGTDTYSDGKLNRTHIEELCVILKEYAKIMKTYKVVDYKACGTSAIREAQNSGILIDLVEQKTGIKIDVISNSEQRFLDYKSIALQGEKFERYIEKHTAILDIGGGSIQMSLFNKDTLVSTQNMKLGVLRLLDRMNTIGASFRKYETLVSELCHSQFHTYSKMYLKDMQIENLILVDDYISLVINRDYFQKHNKESVELDYIENLIEYGKKNSQKEMALKFGVSEDAVPMLFISAILLKEVMQTIGATSVWAPGVVLCDGIAFEYADQKGLINSNHNFEDDIRACALQISKRYNGSRKRSETIEHIALSIFDEIGQLHGLDKRDRLLLQIAAILHDCGKYISMANLAECSYNIIKYTEIIGMSHRERMIIANVVKYNQSAFDYFDDFSEIENLDIKDHMKIAKLTAIIRLANGLDRSHKMKFKDIKVQTVGDELIITVVTDEDISLEKGLFGNRSAFFEETYNLLPVIKQIRSF